mmetsp:Transcript_24848/g.46347  ORF Transcript_24848/g.46347 Transcript_24848/m.46347 type:complete len:238 (+) Transcript_24848:221-934(+)
MKLTFLNAALFTLILLVLCSWCVLHDDISCVVLHASAAAGLNPNGYYVAKGGVYVRKGGQNRIAVIPDFFGLVALSMTAGGDDEPVLIISQDRHRWLIQAQSRDGKGVHRRELYHSSPKHAQQYLFQPPPGDWVQVPTAVSSSATPSELAVRECRGSLVSVNESCECTGPDVSCLLSHASCLVPSLTGRQPSRDRRPVQLVRAAGAPRDGVDNDNNLRSRLPALGSTRAGVSSGLQL